MRASKKTRALEHLPSEEMLGFSSLENRGLHSALTVAFEGGL